MAVQLKLDWEYEVFCDLDKWEAGGSGLLQESILAFAWRG